MDLYVNDHLRIDGEGRTLFHPVDFTSPAYVVPTARLARRITWLHRLHRLSAYIAAAVGIGLGSFLADDVAHEGIAALLGLAAYTLAERPLRTWWPRYARRLASTLEEAHD